MYRFLLLFTLFAITIGGCSKTDGFIKSYKNPLPMINAIGFNNRKLSVSVKTIAPLEDGGTQESINNANIFLFRNQQIFDTLLYNGHERYVSKRSLMPGYFYTLRGEINNSEFYSKDEYLAFPPFIKSIEKVDTTYSDGLYKVCVVSDDLNAKYYLNSASYRLFEDTAQIRHSFYTDYITRGSNAEEENCYFILASKGTTNYFGVVNQSWIDFILSNQDLEGSQNSLNLYNLPVKSNFHGAYGIFGLYSCDSVKIIK